MYERFYDTGITGISRGALCFINPSQEQSASGVGLFTPCGALSIWGTSVYILGLLELQICGKVYYPGMGPHVAQVARVP